MNMHFDSEKERIEYVRGHLKPIKLTPAKRGGKRGTSKKKLSSD